MISFLKKERVIILFVGALYIFHWFAKDIRSPYERPIAGDAQAYYSYLPALFIYQDLDYEFIETDAKQYYPPGGIKDFIFEAPNGEKVNKTFPGVAILYAPFFFAAHVCALTLGLPADGFSSVYQVFFDFGLWVYFLFSLIFLRKLLEKLRFSSKIALFSTILVAFGTNIFFYTVYDQSVTHIFNFFMINGMLLALAMWYDDGKSKWLLIALMLLALIGITRPTNILVIGLIFIIFDPKSIIMDVFRSIFSKKWWIYVVSVLPILAIPFLLWKAQTGNWIVYSYGEEGFDFTDPHFFEFIFSYTKGWMTYTPIVIPILILGGIALFKISKKKFFYVLGFYVLCIYVFSSWWCWYYGAGMSQRVMIDHYVLLAFLLASGLKMIWENKIWRNTYLSFLIILGLFNIAQAHQIKIGVIQNGSITQEGYWDSFLVLNQRARVYPRDNWEFVESKQISAPSWQSEVSETAEYSELVSAPMKDIQPGSKLVLSFEAKSISEVEHSRAVLRLKDKTTKEDIGIPYFLKAFVHKDEWVLMEFLYEPTIVYTDSIKVFFWNGSTQEKVEFRNVKYETFYSEDYY